ncbi:MAG TPA: Lrp/AsnC ligand binding domain-containing protein [Actinomycetota bacterium]|jgi:uncharacterized protein with GYD domain
MTAAYVLIQTTVGRADAVAAEVARQAGVTEANHVTGPYDVVARVEAETLEEAMGGAVRAIQAVNGVTRTITCPVVSLD